MKANPLITAAVLTTALFTAGAVAQTDSQAPSPAAVSPAAPAPEPNQVIYIPRLPNPAELTNAAAAQGITVERIEQTSGQVTVVYKYANGQTNTVAYQLLPPAGSAPAVGSTAAPTTVVTTAPPPTTTVVYAAPGYYPGYYYDPYYYPWPWFSPFSFSVGLDYSYNHFGGGGFRNFGGGGFRHFGGGGFRHFGGGSGFHHR